MCRIDRGKMLLDRQVRRIYRCSQHQLFERCCNPMIDHLILSKEAGLGERYLLKKVHYLLHFRKQRRKCGNVTLKKSDLLF